MMALSLSAGSALASGLASRSSVWQVAEQAETRLVSAVTAIAPGAATLDLGWQVSLKGKWKTYWRAPGDAGLPPDWDWSGSTNVADVEVDWPAPERMTAFGLDSYVYRDDVVLPLRVRLKNPGQAADLRLRVQYMVCAEICVPLEAGYRLFVPDGEAAATAEAGLIRKFAALVPDSRGAVVAEAGHYVMDCGQTRLEVRLASPVPAGSGIDAYVDGPDGVTYGRPVLSDDRLRLMMSVKGAVKGLAATDKRAVEPVHLVLRPQAGKPTAWDGVPSRQLVMRQQTCAGAGS